MNLSAPFVRRPIGTVLLTIGLALAGVAAYFQLPIAPLPQIDIPTISVSASLPGASPDTMASSVATPLERRLGRIADVTEMTSSSSTNSTNVTLQFGLDRNIDGAARDVQAAINASRADLPSTLRSNPTYRKINPADAPILILTLTSPTRSPAQVYDSAANIVQQQLSQVRGVGDVEVGGASLPAVRVELNPYSLAARGVSAEDVRAALASANANRPKGIVDGGGQRFQIYTNDQGLHASDYRSLIVSWRQGSPIRLTDVADVNDSVEDVHNLGLFNGKQAIVVLVTRQPGANIIATVDRIKQILPTLNAALPPDINVAVAIDRTTTIRASLADVERTLAIALVLVVAVTWIFLKSPRATIIPAVAVVASLLGAVGVMFLLGFSLDNLSLMALTVATGFVIDDAIVVLENTTRHLEHGMKRMDAALYGAREVGFTVLSISLSLVAVFIPILLMGGLVGRLFREFAITLSAAIMVSLVVSLTTTPMMCAFLLPRDSAARKPGWFSRASDFLFGGLQRTYERLLDWSLNARAVALAILVAAIVLNAYLFTVVPKGFFPQQDTGLITGAMQADQSASFETTQAKMTRYAQIIRRDPSVASVVAYTGGSGRGGGAFFSIALKPLAQRSETSNAVISRMRRQFADITGATLFLTPVQDVRAGGRQSNATYQYTLTSDDRDTLRDWAGRLTEAMKNQPELVQVNSDQVDHGLETYITVDRDLAARFNLNATDLDNALYDFFGQRQATTIYNAQNQYHVIMEAAPQFSRDPGALANLFVPVSATTAADASATPATAAAPPAANASNGDALASGIRPMVLLSDFARWNETAQPRSVNHQDFGVATTISFDVAEGKSLSDASAAIARAEAQIGLPMTVHGSFQGTAQVYQQSLRDEPMLILAALLAVYIVLGILYESTIHPITVLSTLPSAGLGAVIALILFHIEFSIIAMIGVILLIGIVKKNAILIIDFALEGERSRGLSPLEAIREASLVRFRPIIMTTLAAILSAVPLAIGWGEGAELRRPLGVAIIGGLLVSQALTLVTTPVVYLYLDKFRRRSKDEKHFGRVASASPIPTQ